MNDLSPMSSAFGLTVCRVWPCIVTAASPPYQWLLAFCIVGGGVMVLGGTVVFDNFRRRRLLPKLNTPSDSSPAITLAGRPTTPEKKYDNSTAFPPSRRFVLPQLAATVLGVNKNLLANAPPTVDLEPRNLLPLSRACDAKNRLPKYTPTGFSTDEVLALGDFPAYDVLSGVPLPQPYQNFDPKRALPRPYRPLRWQYHQTMSLKKMQSDWWLEIDNEYVDKINQRKALYEQHGSKLLAYLPGSELVCKELMEMCLQFYCARYPAYFSISADKHVFHNKLLSEDTDIKSMHPLQVLLNNVPEDFGIVLRDHENGLYYMRAGVICSSLGWNVGTKIGLSLGAIHNTTVPDYKEKMDWSMNKYFSKLPTSEPIQRGSWGLEAGKPLFMPPGDPHEKLREVQDPDLKIEDCNLRVDWQTLRRLPLSGGIVFNFTALFTPVQEFRDEAYVPALLMKILREGKQNLMDYKNTWHVEHVVLPELERYATEQVRNGMVKPDKGHATWQEATLAEDPYFPGWEEKWRRQQGF